MAKTASLYIRVDPTVKAEAEKVFSDFGITVTDAVNIFLHKSIMTGGIPFDVVKPPYNAETMDAMREGREMLEKGTGQKFDTFGDLVDSLELEGDYEC